jgi:PEP-CTERM motif
MLFKTIKSSLCIALVSGTFSVAAAPIIGLFNTGVDGAGVSLATGTADAHYTLSSSVSTTAYSGGTNGLFPIGPWVANTGTASWITPTPTASDSFDPTVSGVYIYSLVFDLTGFDPLTAFLNFDIGADNDVSVDLNGGSPLTAVGFTSLTSLGFNSGFIAGLNTLTFTVTNFASTSGNPTGLFVAFTSSNVDALAVPEPGTVALTGLGLIGLGFARRRKR